MKEVLDHFDQNEETITDWRLFIGPAADYYLQQWRRLQRGDWLTFNSYAFLFGIFWMLYRQMLRPTVLFLSIYFAEGFLERFLFQILGIEAPLSWWFFGRVLLFALALGFLGNWIYYQYTLNTIRQIKTNYAPEEHQKILRLKGGTSILPVLLFVILILIIFLAVWMLRTLSLQ